MTLPINNSTMTRMMLVMILRFLDTGFFAFFGLVGLCAAVAGFKLVRSSSGVVSESGSVELVAW